MSDHDTPDWIEPLHQVLVSLQAEQPAGWQPAGRLDDFDKLKARQ